MAGNRSVGAQISAVVSQHIDKTMITERAIVAAVGNNGCGDQIIAYFNRLGGPYQLTEAVFRASILNYNPKISVRALELLLKNAVEEDADRPTLESNHIRPTLDQVDLVLNFRHELHRQAVLERNDDILKILLRVMPTQRSLDARLSLEAAVNAGSIDTVKLLLSHIHESGINEFEGIVSACLIRAVKLDNVDLVSLFLDQGGSMEEALTASVKWSSWAVIESLLDQGVQVPDNRTHNGDTLLHVVASSGLARLVPKLLNAGIDIDAVGCQGYTPLQVAAAAMKDYDFIVEALLSRGANKEVVDRDGRTPLGRAARNGNHRSAERLLSHGANIEAVDHRGRTPLSIAAATSFVSTLELLLAHGADITTRCHDNKQPLDWVYWKPCGDLLEAEAKARKDIEARG
jgi:ankyrin repeat protein